MDSSFNSPKRLLVAPLDWGLGHATRCIPLIRALLHLGCEVMIAAEGRQAALLSQEFPEIPVLTLRGYRVEYAEGTGGFGIKMIRQLPKIRKAIHQEHAWLKEAVARHQIDAVISDNRFGLHHPGIPCAIMTHQLRIKSPFGKITEKWLQQVNYHYIEKFDTCWIVDFEGPENLAGELSHPVKMPSIPVRYLGALSRFEYSRQAMRYDLLVLISGPEPQRTLFEKLILEQLKDTSFSALIVSGKPGEHFEKAITPNISMVNHLDSTALNEVLLQSQLVVCRSGYSSVMDLVKMHKKALLIPTPGQTEQEYLAKYLKQKGYFPTLTQEKFDLQTALEISAHFPYRFPDITMETYRSVLTEILK